MNETLIKALANQKEVQDRYANLESDQILDSFLEDASRRATELLSEGSVHLYMGLYSTEEDINELRRQNEELRRKNERNTFGESP